MAMFDTDEAGRRIFHRILIANRGEIAVRVARACRELDILPLAVYSDADRDALHVAVAGEAYRIGPPPARESYLNVDAILQVARDTGAEAIHPGYGFLSENAGFAEVCAGAGIVFIGPPSEAMRAMGDKVRAKQLMREAGVPVVPGWEGDSEDLERVRREVEALPLPLLVKAAAGGGGRGMRVVRERDDLPEALESARREAQAAFGDGRLFVERLIERPRHIEIQVLADTHGNVVHLGERECSIQRRHQKIIEESPSPAMTPELRAEMGAAAVRAAQAVGYTNAGTVEFIVDPDGNYYFLEMNTRLQVEHPVTELVIGLDLVHLQIRIAAGHPLPFSQDEIIMRGHAVECRLYAEDPASGYLPSTGKLLVFAPPLMPDVRNDVGYQAGGEVTPWYDPMLAKLIVHATDRTAAIERARIALLDFAVLGVTTNQRLLDAVLGDPRFRQGEIDTGFLDRDPPQGQPLDWFLGQGVLPAVAFDLAFPAPASAGGTFKSAWPNDPWRSGAWRGAGTARQVRLRIEDREERIDVRPVAGEARTWEMTIVDQGFDPQRAYGHADARVGIAQRVRLDHVDGHAYLVEVASSSQPDTERDVYRHFIARRGTELLVFWGNQTWTFQKPVALDLEVSHRTATGAEAATGLTAPMPGRVVKVNVAEGQAVEAGQTLLVLEAMKMEHAVGAPYDGTVRRLPFKVGDMVQRGATLVDLEEA